jgi:Tfp pilus assembly protein PilZ
MTTKSVERRSEFRFPVVLPVEYFKPHDSGISSYSLDLSKNGTFISSDDPLGIGRKFIMHLTIPRDDESSKILRTEGVVVMNNVQPFKSKRNGMGVKFIEPLPEILLLNTLAYNVKKLIKENELKEVLEERVKELESELERAKRLAVLGSWVEKILFELSNPILTLSGKLETIQKKMFKHKQVFEDNSETNGEGRKRMAIEFDNWCKEVDHILKEYKIITELAQILRDDRETLEIELKRYNFRPREQRGLHS